MLVIPELPSVCKPEIRFSGLLLTDPVHDGPFFNTGDCLLVLGLLPKVFTISCELYMLLFLKPANELPIFLLDISSKSILLTSLS